MILRRRFSDVIARQIDAFEREQADLVADCEAAERAYDRAERDEAEERYGDYQDVLDRAAGHLADIRDGYARTLDEPEPYREEFERIATRRFPQLGDALKET